MRKLPNRSKDQISQSYNDGLVTIYGQTDSASPGYQPRVKLTEKATLRYQERSMGIQRYYTALQNQQRIERVIRIPKTGKVSGQDVAKTEDGRLYRVELVQMVMDVYPPSVDLSLSRIEDTGGVEL